VARPREDLACLLQEQASGLGQGDGVSRALEEHDAELPFEIPDLVREGRLRHVEASGGMSEVELFGHRHEITQVS
jgi:hypothetical protein